MQLVNEASRPRFRSLARPEIDQILERNHIGRVAYARQNRVDIEPIHYVYADGWINARTSEGAKLQATGHQWWPVAFEVDEVEGLFCWRSVVVHGGFHVLHPERTPWEHDAWQQAVALLRGLIPEMLSPGDPAPLRTAVIRISVQEVAGREALP